MNISQPARFLSLSPMGWWRPGAALGSDFAKNRYMRRGIPRPLAAVASPARATPTTSFTEAGSLAVFGVWVPAITDRGLYVGEPRINKCRNFNANPTDLTGVSRGGNVAATLTLVDDTVELAAAGLGDVCTSGMVFKLDNSAGTTSAQAHVTGNSGNTNPHSFGGYVRSSGNSVRIVLSQSGGAGWFQSAGYIARFDTKTPVNAFQQVVFEAAAGATLWFILNQLEAASFSSPPIVTTGAAGTTRDADIVSILEPESLPDIFELRCDVELERLSDPSDRCIVALGEGTLDDAHLLFVGTDNRLTYEMHQGGVLRVALVSDPIVGTGIKSVRLKSKDGAYELEATGLGMTSDAGTYARPAITAGLWGSRFDASRYLNSYLRNAFLAAA